MRFRERKESLIGETKPPVFQWATTEVWRDGVLHHIGAIPPKTQVRRWMKERDRQETKAALVLFAVCLALCLLGNFYIQSVI